MREQMRMNLDGARKRCGQLAAAAVEAIQFFNDIEKELKEQEERERSKKRYFKLLRDLPTFNAGDIMELGADGCLYFDATKNDESRHYKRWIMVYHKNTLEAFPNIMTDWFEETVVPSPGYAVVMIQKLEKSVKALDERLKAIEGDAKPSAPVRPVERSRGIYS